MKILLTGLSVLLLTCNLWAKELIDVSGIHSLATLKSFKEQLIRNGKAHLHTDYYTYLDSALWNGILVQKVALYNDNMEMTVTREINNGTQKAIRYLQTTYKDELGEDAGWYSRTYTVNNSQVAIKLSMDVQKENKVQANTGSVLNIQFKPVYTQPYPNISKKTVKDPDGIFYFLDTDFFNNNIEVEVDGIRIYSNTGRYQYVNERSLNLNPYILGKGNVNLRVIITPGTDKDGRALPVIQKNSYASATLQKGIFKQGNFEALQSKEFCNYKEYVTDTIVEDGQKSYSSYPGTYHYGKKELSSDHSFYAEVPYTLQGWKNGKDLREDKKLKEKVIALYTQLSQTISAKDADGLSRLFYQMGEETTVAGYNQNAATLTDTWTRWMDMLEFTNVIKTESDFELEISGDGKLVHAIPLKQKDMLRAVGKEEAEGFTCYMYEDPNTNELKFIR